MTIQLLPASILGAITVIAVLCLIFRWFGLKKIRSFYAWVSILAVLGGAWAFLFPLAINADFSKNGDGAALRQMLIYTTGGVLGVITLGENHRKNSLEKAKNDQEHLRQVHAERRSRYTTAIEQLSNDKASIRLGGVYTLVGLVDEWLADEKTTPSLEERRKEGQVIINNLCAYIRSPFLLAERAEHLDEPYAKDLQKDFDGDKEKFDADKQTFKQHKATLEEERQVRLSIIKEMHEHLHDAEKPGPWSGFDYDFSNAHFFYPIDFAYSYFGVFSNFSGVTFTEDANFFGAEFTGGANFNEATFTKRANFSETTFTEGAPFSGATFLQDANFSRAAFTRDADFFGAKFTGYADFFEAEFTGNADFSMAEFTGNAHFSKAKFTGNANFSWAKFTEDTDFSGVEFTGDANFSMAEFTGNAHFSGVEFTGDAHFSTAEFTGSADFSMAEFTGNAHFSWAKFTGNAHFSKAKFTGNADFFEAEFTGNANFSKAKFTDANFSKAKFTDAHFFEAEFTGSADFSGATFEEKPQFEYALGNKTCKARFSCKADPEDYNFEVSPDSPYKIETEEKEYNETKFIIPKGAELFDPDKPSEQEDNDDS